MIQLNTNLDNDLALEYGLSLNFIISAIIKGFAM